MPDTEQAVTKRSLLLPRCAVYRGTGFGDYIISGLIANHDSLVSFSRNLTHQLERIGLRCRTETYVTAGSESVEINIIDP